MEGNYSNWMPEKYSKGLKGAAAAFGACSLVSIAKKKNKSGAGFLLLSGLSLLMAKDCDVLHEAFDYSDENALSWKILEETESKLVVKPGDDILDVGCGSGALSCLTAKKNPDCFVTGVDYWESISYKGDFSREVCYRNAELEGVTNVRFIHGDARNLHFHDESFDAVISNYVYHDVPGMSRNAVMESLRCLKKGGSFAIHDCFYKRKYGDVNEFVRNLKEGLGYKEVHFIRTDNNNPIPGDDHAFRLLKNSGVLYGIK